LIGRPKLMLRRLRLATPPTGNIIVGPLPGALAAKVGETGAAGWAARTESLAMVRKRF
jgi:hypothetical protein